MEIRPLAPDEGSASQRPDTQRPIHVLRLCSVFEPPDSAIEGKAAEFDPIGGMQNHTAELTRALDRRGVIQTVVTTRPPTAPWRDRMGGHATVYRLGVPVKRFRQLYGVQAAGLVPLLARNTDLIHVHMGEDLAVLPIGLAVAWAWRRPLIMTIHCSLSYTLQANDLRSRILKTMGGPIERLGHRHADAIITLTSRLADLLERDGIDPNRIHTIPSGVNPTIFDGEFQDPFPEIQRPRVTYVGRITREKGVETLVHAVPLLREKRVTVLLVGDGPDRKEIETLIHDLELHDRIRITGFLPHDEVPAVLQHSDLLVLPSDYEELGSILLEGMQMGLPIVASRTGGIPDIIEHGRNGLLAEPGHPRAFATAIDRLLQNPHLAHRLGSEARQRAKAYDWNTLADSVLQIYRSLLGLADSP